MIKFEELPAYSTPGQLNDIEVTPTGGAAGDEYTVRILATFRKTEIDRRLIKASDSSFRIYGIGDVVATMLRGVTAEEIYISVSDVAEKKVTVLMASLDIADTSAFVAGSFLRPVPAVVVPCGAQFSLSSLSGAIASINLPSGATSETSFDGKARRIDIKAPATPGVYNVEYGGRMCTVYAVKLPVAHCISFRNVYGAADMIWLRGDLRRELQKNASETKVDGKRRQYDITLEASISFEASNLLPVVMKAAEFLPAASDVRIDGIPVLLKSFKTERSEDDSDLGSVKFTALLADDSATIPAADGVFTHEFNPVFL